MQNQENKIIEQALSILESRTINSGDYLNNPQDVKNYLTLKLAEAEQELFVAVFMDVKNQVLEYNEMFKGTLAGSAVHPREVVKQALKVNAGAVIFAHNHPSGVAEPSHADKQITQELKNILAVIDVRVLDHFIIGGTNIVSFSERGLL